ncbi:MAG: prolipoprotein diacylglyceryl transferase [Acidimicrobiia bacterium]|nr:prolipoprotein diacylglyceryl transferase [Acidimicrobiia bacterium]
MTAFLSTLASIPSPSDGVVRIGPLPIHAYGVMIAVGVIVAIRIAERRYARSGHDPSVIGEMGVAVVLAGVIGARVYHLFTGYDWDSGGLSGTVKIWEGGLSIWGAVAGGVVAVLVIARRRRIDALPLMDAMGPSVVVAQAIGRWGNWFNQELFGRPTDLPWGLEIDPSHRPDGYLDRATFHPTFLYESLWCLLVFATIVMAERRFRLRRGQPVALYIAMYTFGRFFFENMRIDPASKIFGMRFNGLLSAALCIGATIWFIVLGRRAPSGPGAGDERPTAPPGPQSTPDPPPAAGLPAGG